VKTADPHRVDSGIQADEFRKWTIGPADVKRFDDLSDDIQSVVAAGNKQTYVMPILLHGIRVHSRAVNGR
jgi:hypothetical protein